MLSLAAVTLSLFSCNDYQAIEYPSIGTDHPSAVTNVVTDSLPGQIALSWTVPADSNYYYVKVSYFDPLTQKEIVRVASVYKDTLLIPNTRAKYGEYEFKFQSFNRSNIGGDPVTVKGVSGKAPATVVVTKTKIPLTAGRLSTNAQEPTEGAIANLLDGDLGTYFHTAWSVTPAPAGPYWLQVDLGKSVTTFQFYYGNRDNTNNKPQIIDLMGSDDGVNWQLIETINQGLPTGAKSEYTSDVITSAFSFSKLRLVVQATNNGTVFFTMSEFAVYEIVTSVYDPES